MQRPLISRVSLKPSDRAWEDDAARVTCSLCAQAFSVTNRRHHCRVCGSLVCGRCSELVTMLDGTHRACRDCIDCHVHSNKGSSNSNAVYHDSPPVPNPAPKASPLSSALRRPIQWVGAAAKVPVKEGNLEFRAVLPKPDPNGEASARRESASVADHHTLSNATSLTWRMCWVVLDRSGRLLVFHQPDDVQPIAFTTGRYLVGEECDPQVVGARQDCFNVVLLDCGEKWFFNDIGEDVQGWLDAIRGSRLCSS